MPIINDKNKISRESDWLHMGLREKTFLGLGALLLSFLLLMGLATYYQGKSLAIRKVLENIQEDADRDSREIGHRICEARADLMAIANTPPFQGIVRAMDNGGIDPLTGKTGDYWRIRIEQVFTAFAHYHPEYAYMRYIDGNGNEVTRVELEGESLRLYSKSELENRSQYAYFKETLRLRQGEVYYSNISLSRKKGQILIPYKPQFRLATPIYNDRQMVKGIIVININADNLFAALRQEADGTNKYLVDLTGNFLVHPDKAREFGSELGFDYTVRKSHPRLAEEMAAKDAFVQHREGYIRGFHKIHYDPADRGRYWAVIYEIPESSVMKDIDSTRNIMLLVGMLITALSITIITWYVSRKIVSPVIALTDTAKKMSEGDLTVRVQETGAKDEFHILCRTVNSLADSLQHYVDELTRSEERFRSLVQNSSDMIALLDTDGRFSYLSPSAERILGWPTSELIGKSAFELIFPKDVPGMMEAFKNTVRNADLMPSAESRVMGRDGSIRIFESILSNQLNHPSIGHIVVNSRDITDRKESEHRTKLVNRLLRLFAESSSRGEYLRTILDLIRQYTNCSCAGLRVIDSYGNISFDSSVGFSEEFLRSEYGLSMGRDNCICPRFLAGKPGLEDTPCTTPVGSFYCSDISEFLSGLSDQERGQYRGVCVKEGFRAIAVIPILYRGTTVGALQLADKEPGKFSPENVKSIESLTPIVGEAIHRFNLEDDLHNNYFSQAVVNMILSLSLEDLPLEEFFLKTLNMILAVPWLSFESNGKIFLIEDDPGILVLKAQTTLSESPESSCLRVPLGRCVCGRAASTRKTQFADRIDDVHEICHGNMAPHGHYSVPILSGEKTLGVLNITLRERHVRSQQEDELLQTIADTLAGIVMRMQTEAELKRSKASLANAQRIAQLGNWEWEISKNIFIWSDETYRIFGMERVDSGVRYEEFLARIHPVDREFVTKSLNEALCENSPYNIEYRISLPDGSERIVNEHAELIIGQDSVPVRMVGTVQDITEHKIAEEYKEKLQAQLLQAQKMEAVGQLTGGIAHDFNNILTAIMTYGQFLIMKLKKDDPLITYVKQILAASERAANLTHSLLAFSRKQVTNPRPVNLNDIIKEIGDLFFRAMGEDIEFRPLLSDEDLTIMADQKQIEQVLLNLLTNSRDAMPRGGTLVLETDHVQIDDVFIRSHGYGSPGEYALLSVTDTGIGMGEEIKERIFEPFFTTKEVGKGTGLGLAMVYGIIKQHNGYISVYSEPGRGTTFNIYLPLIEAAAKEATPEPETALDNGTETILLAEDNTEVRESTKALLERFGYTVLEAVNGEDAVGLFTDNKDLIDIVLLDVIMPKKNGKETYEELRQMMPDVKVLFMSGYTANIPDKIMVHDSGLDIISKPFTKNQILGKIREVLAR